VEFIIATLKSPGAELVELGPFSLRWYGILIAIALLIGLNISNRLAIIKGLPNGFISDLIPYLVLASLIGARIYYVAFEWRNYSGKYFWSSLQTFGLTIPIPSFIEIWSGGIAIHGALIGGAISVILFCKRRKEKFWKVLDVILPSVALGQAIGRWGNFFNNEAFGIPTELPWKLFIPLSYRPLVFANNNYFHPTFLYESIWDFGVFILLISLFRLGIRNYIKLPTGALSCIYLITYSIGRIWIEGLRIDPLCIGSIPPFCEGGFRVAQFISAILFSLGTLGLWWSYKKRRKMPDPNKIGSRKK